MTDQDTIRVACVGAGYFSRFHLDAWSRIDRARLVGACDLDIAKAEAAGLPAFADAGTMIATTKPDLVDVILPPVAQADAIRAALRLGVRWIVCQKPFTTGPDEARRLIAEADAAGATIVVHENFRFQPWYRALRKALEEEAVGAVLQMTFRLRPGDGQGPEAYLDRQPSFQKMTRFLVRETGVHWVDTFRFLFGDPLAVYADLRRLNPAIAGEDAGYVLFDHPGGTRSLFDGNRLLDHAADDHRRTMGEALVEGTRGVIRLLGDGSLRLRRRSETDERIILPPDSRPGFGGDCVHALQSHLVSAILDGAQPENRAADYLSVMIIEEAIYRSAREGRKIEVEYA